jgi:hypothetical protein
MKNLKYKTIIIKYSNILERSQIFENFPTKNFNLEFLLLKQ